VTVSPIALTENAPFPGALTEATFSEFEKGLGSPTFHIAQNAVTQVTADDVALNRNVVFNTDHSFSNVLDDWTATNQKQSGRCWMFAGLNLFRVGTMQKMGTKSFEFSQNYTMFCDKIERANYFLEAMIDMADRDVDDRTIAYMVAHPVGDGGQWNMFINLVRKHGLIPKPLMPETQSSSDSQSMNSLLTAKLREGAST
jgi:bleomycin hydrolase